MSTFQTPFRQFVFLLTIINVLVIVIFTLWNPFAERLDPSTSTISQLYDPHRDPLLFGKFQAIVSSLSNHTEAGLFPSILDLMNHTWHPNTTHRTNYRDILRSSMKMTTIDHLVFTQSNLHPGDKIPSIDRVKLTTTTSLMRQFQFPKISPFQTMPSYNRCSIVGSSDLLSGSQCGSEIDLADIVFRFNLAPVTGYERDVGTKTTMTTLNPSIYKKKYGNLQTRKQVQDFAKILNEQPDALIWTPAFAFSGNHKPTFEAIKKVKSVNSKLSFGIQDTRHYISMSDFWKSHGLKSLLSTGFYFVNTAIDLCDRVDVFGFWPFNRTTESRPLSYHYFHDNIPFTDFHEMSYEFKLLVAMHSQGLLQLHVRNCTNAPLS